MTIKTSIIATAVAFTLMPLASQADTIGSSSTTLDPVDQTPSKIIVRDGDFYASPRDTSEVGFPVPASDTPYYFETEIERDTSDEGLAKPSDVTQ